MSLIVREPKGSSIVPLEPGVYMAKCYLVADIGEQYFKYKDREGWKPKVVIGWEIEDEFIEIDGQLQPRTVHQFYSQSLDKRSSLRQDLETWRGRPFSAEELEGFNLVSVVGAGCQLQLENNTNEASGKTYTNIKAIMALPKGMKLAPPSQRIIFDTDTDLDKLHSMPKLVQDMVAKSKQMQPEEEKPFADEPGNDANVFGDIDELNELFGDK